MNQQTFTDIEYSNRKRRTRREEFLGTMDRLIPWPEYVEMIRPFYPQGRRGRRPRGIETMLRMYLMKDWFKLSAEGAEDAVCDSYAMRLFLHIDFMSEQVPDATTLLRFSRLLRENGLDRKISADIGVRLKAAGFCIRRSTIADASLGAARPREHRDGV